MTDTVSLGFLGTGLLGFPMAKRLVTEGVPLTVWNRTRSKADPLGGLGAAVAGSAGEVLDRSAVVFTMLSDAAALREVLGPVLKGRGLQERTVVQMGTIAPSESRELAYAVTDAGGEYLEAPVLGSIAQAETRTLIVMVGGTADQFARHRMLLGNFGEKVYHAGPVGDAALLKLALNQLIASLTAAFSLSLGLVERQGLSVDLFMEILRNSALFAQTFDRKLPSMLSHNYDATNFPLKHLLKDVRLIRSAAESLDLPADMIAAVEEVIIRGMARGFAEKDYSSLSEAIRG